MHFIFIILRYFVALSNTILQNNCEALIELYQTTGGANWYTNTNWDFVNSYIDDDFDCGEDNTDICSKYKPFGVTCDNENQIIGVDLSDNNLSGTISKSTLEYLFQSEYFSELDLSDNQLYGTLSLSSVLFALNTSSSGSNGHGYSYNYNTSFTLSNNQFTDVYNASEYEKDIADSHRYFDSIDLSYNSLSNGEFLDWFVKKAKVRSLDCKIIVFITDFSCTYNIV